MRITSKGQVTIPIRIRNQLGLLPETEVDFIVDGEGVRIVPQRNSGLKGRGAKVVGRLRGTGTVRLTTNEILSLTREL